MRTLSAGAAVGDLCWRGRRCFYSCCCTAVLVHLDQFSILCLNAIDPPQHLGSVSVLADKLPDLADVLMAAGASAWQPQSRQVQPCMT